MTELLKNDGTVQTVVVIFSFEEESHVLRSRTRSRLCEEVRKAFPQNISRFHEFSIWNRFHIMNYLLFNSTQLIFMSFSDSSYCTRRIVEIVYYSQLRALF